MADSEALATLAMTGATTVVAAMATSAWEAVRTRTAALFHRRGDSQPDVAAQLDRSAARVAGAEGGTAVHDGEVARWRADLVDLLREHPDTEAELRSLIAEVQRELPPVGGYWVQQVTARDGGSAYGALGPGSSVHVHHHTGGGDQG